MTLPFYKYQGAGNDFVMVDQRRQQWIDHNDRERIEWLCDRRFGIGADGLILLEDHPDYDFRMVYFNSDGRPSSFCGNGGRCVAAFANALGAVEDPALIAFLAADGPHLAKLLPDGQVELRMQEVHSVEAGTDYYFINTGSPHYVCFVEDAFAVPVVERAHPIRYGERFRDEGTNVNFVSPLDGGGIAIATYERGVEAETLACGTGVTAAALAWFLESGRKVSPPVKVTAKGGQLEVWFRATQPGFTDVWLKGPAREVFRGEIKY